MKNNEKIGINNNPGEVFEKSVLYIISIVIIVAIIIGGCFISIMAVQGMVIPCLVMIAMVVMLSLYLYLLIKTGKD